MAITNIGNINIIIAPWYKTLNGVVISRSVSSYRFSGLGCLDISSFVSWCLSDKCRIINTINSPTIIIIGNVNFFFSCQRLQIRNEVVDYNNTKFMVLVCMFLSHK
jgi:hypothetical protein